MEETVAFDSPENQAIKNEIAELSARTQQLLDSIKHEREEHESGWRNIQRVTQRTKEILAETSSILNQIGAAR